MERVRRLQQTVAEHYGYTLSQLLGRGQSRTLARARHVAMHIARERYKLSTAEVGRAFQRDHTTVVITTKKLRQRIQQDPELAAVVERLTPRPLVEQYVPPWEDCPELLPLPHPPRGALL